MVDNDMPGAWPVWTPVALLAAFIKGFGEEDFLKFFPMTPPGAGPVWTPGARFAGFIKRTTIHSYTQNMKALGLVVSEKKIF